MGSIVVVKSHYKDKIHYCSTFWGLFFLTTAFIQQGCLKIDQNKVMLQNENVIKYLYFK